jgi:hypothetical protein
MWLRLRERKSPQPLLGRRADISDDAHKPVICLTAQVFFADPFSMAFRTGPEPPEIPLEMRQFVNMVLRRRN